MFKERAIQRVDQLILQAKAVLATEVKPSANSFAEPWVHETDFAQWRTSSLSFLKSVFSENGAHLIEYRDRCKRSNVSDCEKGFGILKAAKDDLEFGFLKQIEDLVSADIFSDFVSMAEHLLKENYFHAAASLLGAVLEDALRRICASNNVPVKKSDGLAALNEKLHSQAVYNKIMFKSVDSWREIRNSADHGKFEDFERAQVESMLFGVQGLLLNHLS